MKIWFLQHAASELSSLAGIIVKRYSYSFFFLEIRRCGYQVRIALKTPNTLALLLNWHKPLLWLKVAY